jgi:hypothetical protein
MTTIPLNLAGVILSLSGAAVVLALVTPYERKKA